MKHLSPKNTLTLALRGLARNRRRSAVTLLAIAFGFAAITLFAGYTHNVYGGLARLSIHGEMLGHLTLSKRGMRQEGKLNPERYLLTTSDVDAISAPVFAADGEMVLAITAVKQMNNEWSANVAERLHALASRLSTQLGFRPTEAFLEEIK